jgi:hypothetical protein
MQVDIIAVLADVGDVVMEHIPQNNSFCGVLTLDIFIIWKNF